MTNPTAAVPDHTASAGVIAAQPAGAPADVALATATPQPGLTATVRPRAGLLASGIVGIIAFRVWEVVDAWVGPPLHNKKVRGLRGSLGLGPQLAVKGLYLAPPQTPQGSGGVAGLELSF
ncbi:MAG: hypothetical protein ABL886_14895 [Rhodoglobus sp.]